ncbi:unnamed protein product [Toxocara canis]|uniref:Rx_N domain-containing protein n=1 Tax=Toxocara canis TaxID=6265 RepID=A0A183UWB1_TOXCA|nr:unnamed protein product [Toxocara canis]
MKKNQSYVSILILILTGVAERLLPLDLSRNGRKNLQELAKSIAVSLLSSLTLALSDKLQAAVQTVVNRLDKLTELMSTNQSLTTQSWVESLLHAMMAKVMQIDINVMDEKNKRAVFIGI